jgi:5S rRNA maturation endonuclease (ribonuclease M5)
MDIAFVYDKLLEFGCEKVSVVGKNVMCLCPFHPERRSPSFGVHPQNGANCFACGVKFKSIDKLFRVLADKRGIDYEGLYTEMPENFDLFPDEEPEPEPLNANVLKFYRRDDDRFKNGWGVSQEVIDRRRLCVDPSTDAECFPIFDRFDQYWGMVERHTGGKRRRYHYPSGYPRSSILLGEDQAIAHSGDVWVVEGVRDLCAVETKVDGAVGVALGSAWASDEQLDTLRKFDSITLALDNDDAGKKGRDWIMKNLDPTNINIAKYQGKDPMDALDFQVEDMTFGWLKIG